MPGVSTALALNDQIECRVVCIAGEQISINALHYKVTAVTGIACTTQDVATDIDSLVEVAYKALMGLPALYRGVECCRLFPTRSVYANEATNVGPGGAGADLLPRQTCGIFTKMSAVPGAAGRGRVYVPFPALVDDEGGGIPTAGYMTRLGTLAGILLSNVNIVVGVNTTTITPIIYHRGDPTTSVAWTFAAARNKWASQRSRGTYGRANSVPF